LVQTKPSEFDFKKTVLTTQKEKQLLKRMWKLAQNSQNLFAKVLRIYVFTIVEKIMFQNCSTERKKLQKILTEFYSVLTVKVDSHIACRAVNSHMPCRASAMLRQCRVLRESPRGSRKKPNAGR
jgi:hypothetical protein